MKKYQSWTISFFILSFFLAISIIALNLKIDSFNLFNYTKLTIAKDLLNGYYISGENISVNRVDNIYDPLLKNIEKIDILAIGSSKTMLLHKDILFKDKNPIYYNFTDGTARLKHYAKILGLLNKYEIKYPSTIILGLDPWVFDQKASLTQIKALLNNTDKLNTNKYSQLFNYEYTKLNLLSLFNQTIYNKSKRVSDLHIKTNKNMIISPNGDIYYPVKENNLTLDELLQNVQNNIQKCDQQNYDTKCVKYNKLTNFQETKYLLTYLKNKNVNVVVYFAPFEPTFYDHICKYNNFSKHYTKIKSFLRKNDINTIGSYNPHDLNLTSSLFLDSIHPNEKGIKKIFSKINLDIYIK